MVSSSECHLGLRDHPKHACILQGESSYRFFGADGLLMCSGRRSRERSGELMFVDECGSESSDAPFASSPPDNDRYVSHAPENPKKVSTDGT